MTFENGETYLDRLELSPEIFVQKMAASRLLPKTAAPDPSTFIEHFEKGLREAGEVLFVSLSSGLSSTYEIAQLAKNLLGNTTVSVFDTLSASLGTGIMAVRAAHMAAKGFSMDEIIKGLTSTLKTKKRYSP